MSRLLVALAAILTALAPARADPTETEAVVVKLGGTAKVDQTLDETARVSVSFETGSDAILVKLGKLPDVGALRITDATKCSAQGLAALRELPNLQRLQLGKCPLNETKANVLGNLRTLDTLHVGESKLTDVAMTGLKKLVNLKSLDLLDAPISDRAVPALLALKKLEELNLAGTKITDKGVPLLAPLENLKTLKLQNTAATRKGIDAIEKALPKLTVRY